MSQAKVDQHKLDKKNVKKYNAKEKRERFLTDAVLGLIAVVIVAWIGISAYNIVTAPKTTADDTYVEYTLDNSAINDYLGTLQEA